MNTTRHRLPNRRECIVEDMNCDGMAYTLSTGINADGKIAEVFISTGKGGSEVSYILEDFAVVLSVALQFGVLAQELGASVGRLPRVGDALTPRATLPASPLGQVLDRLAEIEKGETA